jgi:fructokinase
MEQFIVAMIKDMEHQLCGGVELGGTKTICAIADANGAIAANVTFPTTNVDETFEKIFEFFEQNQPVVALGVGSFGPVQLSTSSAEFGWIYNSPKPGWSNVNVKGLLEQRLGLAVSIDTDVNCAALGELHYGVAQNVRSFVYLTLGTGIGGSLVHEAKLVHGILNLEMGHMRVPHEPFTDGFGGACVFHGDCLEGISSGYAMAQRYGKKPQEITDMEVWDIEAGYIASAVNNLMMTVGPELIVIGGGLTNHSNLMALIRAAVQQDVNNYLRFPDLESYIVQASSDKNGVLGAIKLNSLTN